MEPNRSDRKPLSSWWEEENIDGRKVRSLTVILKTKGCRYSDRSPCTMCGYNSETWPTVGSEDLIEQIRTLEGIIPEAEYMKIFTSGSFLDPGEVPDEARSGILETIHDLAPKSRLLVESRPEFVSESVLKSMLQVHDDIEIAYGLETTDDRVRNDLIGKMFKFSDFLRSADITIGMGIHLKTYLLLKPPFLSEADSIRDVLGSIAEISGRYEGSTISINPVNVQKDTIVEELYLKGQYRPPWLWSVIEVLRAGSSMTEGKVRLISHPTGGGRRRGAHNCGDCDPQVLEMIQRFDLTGDISDLDLTRSCCLDRWREYLRSGVSM